MIGLQNSYLRLPLRTINRFLIAAVILVAGAGLASELSIHFLDFGRDDELIEIFNLSEEGNLPTFYTAILLLSCAVLLRVIQLDARERGRPYSLHWGTLAAAFLYISVDESVTIHENLNRFVDLGGIFYFEWVIPAGIVVFIFGLSYLRFLAHLEVAERIRFIRAGIAYVGGALGVELILGYWSDVHHEFDLGYGLIDFCEETLEIIGVSLFLSTLLRYISENIGSITLKSD